MRLSRPCYDKFHRCPGWIGGGMRYAKVQRCDNGRIQVDYNVRLYKWRFWKCNTCDVVVFPYIVRYIDPTNWKSEIKWWLRHLEDKWRYRNG